MLTLSDGTPIQMQEEAYDTLLGWLEDAFDDNDQEVLVEIHGYGFPRAKGGPMHLAARRG